MGESDCKENKEFLGPVHKKPMDSFSFDRLEMLWKRHPQYHEMTAFSTMAELLPEHESWQEDFEEFRGEYDAGGYDRFLVQLSYSDLSYRYATKELIQEAGARSANSYVEAFMEQFAGLDTERKACFLFPESFVTQFFVIAEVCKKAEVFHPIRNLFPDEEKVHFLAVFNKADMDTVLLMYHLLYTNASEILALRLFAAMVPDASVGKRHRPAIAVSAGPYREVSGKSALAFQSCEDGLCPEKH